jgi:RNA polymerase sigma-70 factor (ECF subfamily)
MTLIWPEKVADADKSPLVKPQQAPSPPFAQPSESGTAERLAQRALFEEATAYVLHSLRRVGVPETDRDELAQEILIAAYAKRGEYQPERASLRQWIHGFMVNFVRNYRRSKQKSNSRHVDLPRDLADETQSLEDKHMAERLRRLLHEDLFPQIELDLLTVLIARALDDLDFKTIAEEQGIPISTAHDRYQRGIIALKAAYARHQRRQVARGLLPMPFTIEQLLAADRKIPEAPADLVRDAWTRVHRALLWKARRRALLSLARRAEVHLAATFLAGGVVGAILHAAFLPTPHPAPAVFVQPPSIDVTAPVATGTLAPRDATSAVPALPAPATSSASRRDPSDEQRAFDVAHQAFDRGNLDAALAGLAAHERDFPGGLFASEREILRARIANLRAQGGQRPTSPLPSLIAAPRP